MKLSASRMMALTSERFIDILLAQFTPWVKVGSPSELRCCTDSGCRALDLFRNHKGLPISASQEQVRFRIADHLFSLRIKAQRAPQPIRGIRQVNQGA